MIDIGIDKELSINLEYLANNNYSNPQLFMSPSFKVFQMPYLQGLF